MSLFMRWENAGSDTEVPIGIKVTIDGKLTYMLTTDEESRIGKIVGYHMTKSKG